MNRLALAVAAALALAGCATSNPDVVSRADAQYMSTVTDATVLSVRAITIEGSQSGAGAVAGGVLGAVAGGVIGNAAERYGTREEGVEIMVQLRSGERRSIVQAKGNETFAPGDPVILVATGNKVRVMRAPAIAPPPPPVGSTNG